MIKIFGEIFGKYRHGIIHFVKFNFVGILNTGITVIVYNILLFFKVDELFAYPIAYVVGLVNSFIMNKLWTFGKRQSFSIWETVKFTIVNLIAFGGGQLFLYFNKTYFLLSPVIAQLLTLIFSIPCNYIGAKYWVFKE
jgi:putative flippase GtrA